MTRFAAYIRYSHEDQADGYSYDSQKRIVENFVRSQKGRLVAIYFDGAESGRTINNRDDFLRMRQDACKKRFDALVVAKFDRLSRSRMDAIVVIDVLALKPPADWRDHIVQAVGQVIGNHQLEERMAQIRQIIERMDFRWDSGFISNQDEYMEQRHTITAGIG